MQFQKLKGKLSNEKKLARRISGLFGIVPALIMAFSFFPANQAQALEVDLSNEDFVLLAADPAVAHYNLGNCGWCALGIKNNGATNHSPAEATHDMHRTSEGWGYNLCVPRFHPKNSKSYNGKYGNRAYTLMDDSFGNKNIFKMLEVTDKSGDAGKKLRGTSKFYSGDKDWQRFEFEFAEDRGILTFEVGENGQHEHHYIDGHLYKVHMRSEKTGNYITGNIHQGDSMYIAHPGENTDLWMIVWASEHCIY